MSTHPEVLWAQRSNANVSEKNVIYLTINLPDIDAKTLEFNLTATKLSFKARTSGGSNNYEFDLEFFAEIDPEKSTNRLSSRSLFAILRKKESKSEYWPRLVKEKLRPPFIKTDFSKWADEDEQEGNPGVDDENINDPAGAFPGMGSDFDLSKLSGDFGAGAGDFSGGDAAEEDSDDDGPPPLEDPETAK